MGEDDRIRQRVADVVLDRLQQLMSLVHRPVPGNQDVDRDEPARARLSGAQRMSLDPGLSLVPLEHAFPDPALPLGHGRVEQTEQRTAPAPATSPHEIGGY